MAESKYGVVIDQHGDSAFIGTDENGDGFITSNEVHPYTVGDNHGATRTGYGDEDEDSYRDENINFVLQNEEVLNNDSDNYQNPVAQQSHESNTIRSTLSGSGGGSLPWRKIGIFCIVILVIYGLITVWDYIQFLLR